MTPTRRRLSALCLFLPVLLLLPLAARAASEIKMAGDMRVYGIFFQNKHLTGWNPTGKRTEDSFEIWQRFRVRTDFTAAETVKFRLGVQVTDTPWGQGTYVAANPTVSLEAYQAYLQFFLPDSPVEMTIGLQQFSLPQSPLFFDSVVLASKQGTKSFPVLVLNTPLYGDTVRLNAGMGRLRDVNRTYDPSTSQVGDELDIYFLTLPVTLGGLQVTPWATVGVVGRSSLDLTAYRNGLVSGGWFEGGRGYVDNQNAAAWLGAAMTLSALDPIKVYGDVIYGQAALADAGRNHRQGVFADLGAEYTGLSWGVPTLGAWWASGEDDNLGNGSERMPVMMSHFGIGGSWLFACGQDLSNDNLGASPLGAMGLFASIRELSLIENLSQTLTLTAMAGTSSARGMRRAVAASGGNGAYLTMGRELAEGERLYGLNYDSRYRLNENLSLIVESGWARMTGANGAIWNGTRNFTGHVADAWKAALGFRYVF